MSHGERPLLARQSSEDSSRRAEEEDALLTGQPTHKTANRRRRYIEIGVWSWASLATIAVVILAVVYSQEKSLAAKRRAGNCGHGKKPHGKRNLVFMVSDGMGPASVELARSFRQYTDNLPWDDVLTLDKHLIGTSRTRSSNTLVTDSAAGATAFSCGFKSYNGAISVLPDHTPCGTVLEAAKKAGYLTGLVVTTAVVDATPAAFASHVQSRSYKDMIAEQLLGYYPLGRTVDLIVGGGRCHFLPNTTEGSCRQDDTDLVAAAKRDGWNYIDNKEDFTNLRSAGGVELPLLALMAPYNIPFEIDRQHQDDVYPSQLEMATLALNALKAASADNDKGFFLMVEGSRVDHAGHNNDPAAQVRETLMHDKTFKAVLDFLEGDEAEGVLVSTSDHETGGLSAATQNSPAYPPQIWYPEVLANASISAEVLGEQWKNYLATPAGQQSSHDDKYEFINSIMLKGFNFEADPDEIEAVIDNGLDDATFVTAPKVLFAHAISRRALVGWSTIGHSGVDVNIYGSDPAYTSDLAGNHENVEVGRFLARYLDVDVDEITEELKDKTHAFRPAHVFAGPNAWTGPRLPRLEASRWVDHYHPLDPAFWML